MHFDGTITAGNLLTLAGIVISIVMTGLSLYSKMDRRLAVFETLLGIHTTEIERHAKRMEAQDEALKDVTIELQRLVAQMSYRDRRPLMPPASEH